MSENYASKRERMQKALDSLPAGLRGRISLRNAEAVAGLVPLAQNRLADALDLGLVKVSLAIGVLGQDPQASLAELLPSVSQKRDRFVSRPAVSVVSDEPVTLKPGYSGVSAVSAEYIPGLARLIRTCYPDMPQIAAEALASSPAMGALGSVYAAQEAMFSASQAVPDFVVVTFFGLLRQTQERLDKVIAHSVAYQQALHQSGINMQI